MTRLATRHGAAIVLAAAAVCAPYDRPAVAAEDDVVVTVEVTEHIRHLRFRRNQNLSMQDVAPLPQPQDFPMVVIEVDPADPKDYVATINGTAYQAGARKFRLSEGKATISVSRRGKDACLATLDVTAAGPNLVPCRF
jgi:hypothetical protein